MQRVQLTWLVGQPSRTGAANTFTKGAAALGLGFLLASSVSLAEAKTVKRTQKEEPVFAWRLTNRFRLLSETDEIQFQKDFAVYRAKAAAGEFSFNPAKWQKKYAVLSSRPYSSKWDPAQAQYDFKGYLQSSDRHAALSISVGTHCRWTVNGSVIPDTKCRGASALLRLGANTVTVSVDDAPSRNVEGPVVNDYFAIVLGDSTASGEGNPEVAAAQRYVGASIHAPAPERHFTPAQWLDERCHRSMISGPLPALLEKSKKDFHRSVTVVDYACSGAELDNGIMDAPVPPVRPYQGRETPDQLEHFYRDTSISTPAYYGELMLPAQVTQAEQALCLEGRDFATCPKRKLDSVIVITGANDLHFSKVLTTLILKCRHHSCFEGERTMLTKAAADLSVKFDRLHDRIKNWNSRQVLLGGYVDPTHDSNGVFCDDNYLNPLQPHFVPGYMGIPAFVIGAHLGRDKSEFASGTFVTKLDNRLADVANKYRTDNWVYVNDYAKASLDHGVCAKKRWVLTYEESATKQGILQSVINPNPVFDADPLTGDGDKTVGGVPSGAMHPNVFGHIHMAEAFLAHLAP